MIRIKICGITNLDDAILAVDYGADALGFMFYKGSKRYISPNEAQRIISKLPPFVITVGVFVNQELDEIRNIQGQAGFDIVQLHGNESPDFCKSFGERAIKAIRVKDNESFREVESYSAEAILFDTYSNESYGGTGMSFNWEILKNFRTSKKIILSGGLSPENVTQAIGIVNPYAVDVSSGVEGHPGKKSPEKLKRFIEAVRNGNETKTTR
jgi:phosphoribosylanthranilate isomerase